MRRMLDGGTRHKTRPREERRKTLLPARIRSETGWSDACILNVSSRGLLIYSSGAAQLGSFVEIRRGGQLVIARVVWRSNQRIGLCSTDPIHVDDIISTNLAGAAMTTAAVITPERRKIPRDAEVSRSHGRAAEFVATVFIATALAAAGAVYVRQTLTAPLSTVKAALAPR